MLNILVAAAAMTFPGGTTNDLVKALGDSFKQNVVIAESSVQPIAAFDYEPGNLNLLAQNLRWKTPLQLTPGADLIGTDGMLPDSVTSSSAARRKSRAYGEKIMAAENIKAGKVQMVTTGNERVLVKSLSTAPFSKPLTIHWVYADYVFASNAKDMSETDFLTFVAKSVGGRLLSTEKAFEIQVDPVEVRRRAIKTIEGEKISEDPTTKTLATAKNKLRVAAIQMMTTKQLTDYLSRPDSTIKIPLTGSLVNPATNYVKAVEQTPKQVVVNESGASGATVRQRGRQGAQQANNAVGVLQRVDPRQTSYVVIQPLFQVGLEIATLGRGGVVKM